ncbi:hypothetical protein GCM10011387_25210 [Pedobacter quisquiliarum]|uniref:Uncharacterized protein n=2 Tax=Pedobacter quisquiliarum TaxID=1834438 RepID=A0A916UH37_9SPHI|nr:hypothetical protein GCM10011387_25210 [Pedobacter quisquiliarum]
MTMEKPVPAQESGSEMNAVEEARFDSAEAANAFYAVAKQRLLDVNKWDEVAKLPSSTFILCDASGERTTRNVQLGDYLKIDIPGPGTSTGDGYDWVQVEFIEEQHLEGADIMSFRVRPTDNPLSPEKAIAHFFDDAATSTFQVKKLGNVVTAEVHGRNETPNTHTDHILDNVRNTMVGLGAKIGASYPQWKGLVAGIAAVD